ncbi:MAG: endonuclease III [Leptospiraceae bacterium]|nr:endonuclease III [Leptospiraceae bacterium]
MVKPSYVKKIDRLLKEHFGPVKPPLDYSTNEQLAIAVILSAQCTDERVNLVTPALFAKYPDMVSLAKAKLQDIEKLIFSTGFYHNKAKNILALAKILTEQYAGKIPADFEVLTKLPGIGRKTANVIMNLAFDQAPGIVVDTHVRRISQRLGFTTATTPETVEKALMKVWPKEVWIDLSLYMIFLGRKWCMARKPNCEDCILTKICPKLPAN